MSAFPCFRVCIKASRMSWSHLTSPVRIINHSCSLCQTLAILSQASRARARGTHSQWLACPQIVATSRKEKGFHCATDSPLTLVMELGHPKGPKKLGTVTFSFFPQRPHVWSRTMGMWLSIDRKKRSLIRAPPCCLCGRSALLALSKNAPCETGGATWHSIPKPLIRLQPGRRAISSFGQPIDGCRPADPQLTGLLMRIRS